VDDSAAVRARLLALLGDLPGAQLYEACDAEEGLALARARSVEAVILDLNMPGKSGLAILGPLKGFAAPPVVFVLTGDPTEQHRRNCLALGADAFLDKAHDFDRVVELLRARLPRDVV